MSGLQKTVVWLTGFFMSASVIIYVFSGDTSRPEIFEWIKTIVDWAAVAGVGGVAGNLLSTQSFNRKAQPQLSAIHEEIGKMNLELSRLSGTTIPRGAPAKGGTTIPGSAPAQGSKQSGSV